jgi:hypothetical protein
MYVRALQRECPVAGLSSLRILLREQRMVTLKDIEKSFEAKFAHDEELKFRAHARCNRLVGQWAAKKLNLNGAQAEAYARDLVMADFDRPGTDAVFRRIRADFDANNVAQSDREIRRTIDGFLATVLARLKTEG